MYSRGWEPIARERDVALSVTTGILLLFMILVLTKNTDKNV